MATTNVAVFGSDTSTLHTHPPAGDAASPIPASDFVTLTAATPGADLNLAIAALPSIGGRITIYPDALNSGVYELEEEVAIDKDNVEIVCLPGVVFQQVSPESSWSNDDSFFDFQGHSHCTFRGGRFVWTTDFDLTMTVGIRNVATAEDSNAHFTVEGTTWDFTLASIDDLIVFTAIQARGDSPATETRRVRIVDNNFDAAINRNSLTCIMMEDCTHSQVSRNSFGPKIASVATQNYRFGIRINEGRLNTIAENSFSQITGTGLSGQAHILIDSDGTEGGHCNVIDNLFETSGVTGIDACVLLRGSDFVIVSGNNFGRCTNNKAVIKAEVRSNGVLGRGLNITDNIFHAIVPTEDNLNFPIHIDGYERVNIQGNVAVNWDAITQDYVRVDSPATLVVFNDNTNPAFPGSQSQPRNRVRSPINFRGPRNQEWVENCYPGTRNY